ncbi:hypothetical protein [Mongoliitalea lutea]|uniref:hypothetical protein n=1 Tax=Mongoliitalea lutea TaxID=849756 RepID=UPI001678CB41|nr:hypothetical protein [Mongoliitalea lutea]
MRSLILALFAWTACLVACSAPEETTCPKFSNISESVFASGLIKAKGQYRAYANTNGIWFQI